MQPILKVLWFRNLPDGLKGISAQVPLTDLSYLKPAQRGTIYGSGALSLSWSLLTSSI